MESMKRSALFALALLSFGCSFIPQHDDPSASMGVFTQGEIKKWHEAQWDIAARQKVIMTLTEGMMKKCVERKKGEELKFNSIGDPDCLVPDAPVAPPAKK